MMKKIPKMVKIVFGVMKGVLSTLSMTGLFPGLEPVAELLMIVNCAFCITLFTAGEEQDSYPSVVFLYWLISMALTICSLTSRITMIGVIRGILYAVLMLSIAYGVMRIRLRIAGVAYDSEEGRALRLCAYDDLFRRFFGESLMETVEQEAKDGE